MSGVQGLGFRCVDGASNPKPSTKAWGMKVM